MYLPHTRGEQFDETFRNFPTGDYTGSMAKSSEATKRERKEQVLLIVRQSNGIRESEIAESMQLGRRTVNNYLLELEREGKLWKEGVLWFLAEHRATVLRSIEMSPEQAFTAYLALRLMGKHLDRRNEPAETTMYKLATMLDSSVEINRDIVEAAAQLAKRQSDKQHQETFRTVVQAYLYRRKLKIVYKPLNGTPFETTFSTYLIEPVIIGHALYLIGHSDAVDAIRSYKLERVQSATMLQDEYPIEDDFPGLQILQNAWSIVFGEETTHVVLRFAPSVAERVRETRWHPSGRPTDDPDKPDHLRYTLDVASTLDLLPWIRSWGADVEVVEPLTLRDDIAATVQKMSRLYQLTITPETIDDRLRKLWGKTSKDGGWHPALYHMIDVGHVAQFLLSPSASPRWRTVLGHVLNTDPERLHQWLPYLIALHDIGKLSPPFQAKNKGQRHRLKGDGFDFGRMTDEMTRTLHHTTVGRLLLKPWAEAQFNRPLQYAFLEMVSGHHGAYQTIKQTKDRWPLVQEPDEWEQLRGRAMDTVREQFLTNPPDPYPEPENVSAAIVALNGFTILCDWLGSDGSYFKPHPHTQLATYITHSRKQAQARVEAADFFHAVHSDKPTSFRALFPSFTTLRPVQAAVDHIPDTVLSEPTLTIIEAPTGEGKTEAAWALAHRIGRLRQTDELYIALPTTATSNAMFTRTKAHLTERLNLPKAIKLIHGQDFLIEDQLTIDPMDNGDDDGNGEPHPALTWFTSKKTALLAPFGVGTIDQAELSTLNVKHNALRMIGLAGKVVILDEVHAYDTYMTTIIKRMLMWLSTMGSSVILLSATLPLKRRRELLAAWTEDVPDETNREAYPALMTVGRTTHHIHTEPLQSERTITLNVAPLHFTDDQAKEKAAWLFEQVKAGGCACWITNLVDQAQQIYREVAKLIEQENDPLFALDLLHARFPLNQRHEIEQMIMGRYTKPSEAKKRPKRGIVIGTQVLEQSLDLDFDVMVSDLAPIDLLLQRAGRLHRHQKRKNRAKNHPDPHFYVNAIVDNDTLQFGNDKFYGEYILALTWREIARVCAADNADSVINLPADYRPLIEAVYDEQSEDKEFAESYTAHIKKQAHLEKEAKDKLMGKPNRRRPFTRTAKLTFNDEEGISWVNASTRYIEQESITVIPLIPIDDETAQLPDGTMITLTRKANKDDQLCCLRHQVRLSRRDAVNGIKMREKPAVFQSNHLKHAYPLFLPFHTKEGLMLQLDDHLGIIYEKNN